MSHAPPTPPTTGGWARLDRTPPWPAAIAGAALGSGVVGAAAGVAWPAGLIAGAGLLVLAVPLARSARWIVDLTAPRPPAADPAPPRPAASAPQPPDAPAARADPLAAGPPGGGEASQLDPDTSAPEVEVAVAALHTEAQAAGEARVAGGAGALHVGPPVSTEPEVEGGAWSAESRGTPSAESVVEAALRIEAATSAVSRTRRTLALDPLLETPHRPRMMPIPAGSFLMGSPEGEGFPDEHPRHSVALSHGFWIAATPVTQAQFAAVAKRAPSHFADRPAHPVENVSWFDAVGYCNALSRAEGLPFAYVIAGEDVKRIHGATGYRLPTEAEWEYACRAGTTSRWWFGDDEVQLARHAWYAANSGRGTHAVATTPGGPNPWGLYDMHGNVWEWCEDGTDAAGGRRRYLPDAIVDPAMPPSGPRRVVRGGSWAYGAGRTRSANRDGGAPGDRNQYQGFRVVRPAPELGH